MKEAVELLFESPWFYLLGIILGGTYFYFKRKFENLADKEDVSDLKREVELVKNEFNKDLEGLKSNLNLVTTNKINLVNEKRTAIYDFWASLNLLYQKVTSILDYKIKDFSDYHIFQNDINKVTENFIINKSTFELKLHEYLEDELKEKISNFAYLIIEEKRNLQKTGIDIVDFQFNLSRDKVEIEQYSDILKSYNITAKIFIENIILNLDDIKGSLVEIIERLHNQ